MIIVRSIAVVLALAAAAGGCGPAPTESPPRPRAVSPTSGPLDLAGLRAPVAVIRDRWGVPHIRAANQDDLFFAQGFVQAQDRLFQMDLWRRASQGRLSEVLGANFIERDAMTRRIQYRGDLEEEWRSYGSDARSIATSFTRGINAWVDLVGDDLPEAFALAGWRPERWRADDVLNRADAWLASGNAVDEVFRAQLVAALGVGEADRLLPSPSGRTLTDADLDPAAVNPAVADLVRRAGAPPFFSGLMAPVAPASNAWAASIARTSTGGPVLAVDPHRPLTAPSLRYLVHLHAPGWHVAGATAPWLPGVAIGHNDRMAWGMTAFAADTQDIYVERLNPSNERQVLEGDRWVDLTIERESIEVKGRPEPFTYERRYSPRGVVIGMDRERHLAFSLRWSGAAPGAAAELGALSINRAESTLQFQEALLRWKMPASEFVYADAAGGVGRQAAALVPRRIGGNGDLPVPAWRGRHDWHGWHLPSELPRSTNRAAGVVVSANDNAARVGRITDVLAGAGRFDVEGFAALQRDTYAWNADRLVPLLARVRGDSPEAELARGRLLAWDRRVTDGSGEGALYVAWEQALMRRLSASRVPPPLRQGLTARSANLLVPALLDTKADARDAILRAALDDAAPATLPPVLFSHPLAVVDRARQRFNVGPFAVGGYEHTVMSIARPGADRAAGAGFRAVFDVADWDRSLVISAPGQSESPTSPHYRDMADLWQRGGYIPLAFTAAAVDASAVSVLMLRPVKQ